MKQIEHEEQVKLFSWAKAQSAKHSELTMMFAIPNGGHRNIITATKLKSEGVKKGIPDIFLPVPKQNYHGLFVEMKSPKGRLSDSQAEWLNALRSNGYMTAICFSFDEAKEVIKSYLGI